jgi:ATP-dependent DNA helicase RecG
VAKAAIREAVINAIVHRDYSSGVPIQIKVFPDELIIYNDGGLPPGWTVNDLLTKHRSLPNNPDIANAFFRSGQIEAWGRGIEKIETTSREAHKPIPVFKVRPGEVNVTFRFPATPTTSSTSPVVDVVDIGKAQARAVQPALAENPSITQKELDRLVGVTERTISRQVKKLRETGVIRRIG